MPLYEFTCKDCGKSFDRILDYGDYQCECPNCGGEGEKTNGSLMFTATRLPNGFNGGKGK